MTSGPFTWRWLDTGPRVHLCEVDDGGEPRLFGDRRHLDVLCGAAPMLPRRGLHRPGRTSPPICRRCWRQYARALLGDVLGACRRIEIEEQAS